MSVSSRGSAAVVSLIRSSRHPRICPDCRIRIVTSPNASRRTYAAAAAAATAEVPPTAPLSSSTTPSPAVSTDHLPAAGEYVIKAGVVISRPPLLTRPQTAFEKAFFFYQKRLNERLAMPFTRYFYFKPDTPADADWKVKAKERNGVPAKELGGYMAYGKEAWNDEVLVGDKLAEPEHIIDSLVRDAEVRTAEEKYGQADKAEATVIDRPLDRKTQADLTNDTKRLDRALDRTLYLCVKRENGGWGFPSAELIARENLYQAAERTIVQAGGMNMNTWVIGHAPVAHHIIKPRDDRRGEKTFFMKVRIMAGQANLKGNLFGLNDFKWLTREELEQHVSSKYYSSIRNMLAER